MASDIKIKRPNLEGNFLINVLFFLKPITDMLYQYQILDIAMLILASAILLTGVRKVRFYKYDIAILMLAFLLTISLLKDLLGIRVYIKMISPLILLYALRDRNLDGAMKSYLYSYIFVLILNLLSIIMGEGRVVWGNTKTISGLYYYKTDFACAMTQAMIVFMYFSKESKSMYLFIAGTFILTLFSNSRIAILIDVLILVFYFYVSRKQKKGKFKFRTRYLLYIVIGFVLLAGTIFALLKSPLFQKYSFLTIDINNLFSESNTQGRSEIWKGIIDIYEDGGAIEKILGIDLTSDVFLHHGTYYGSHSMYLKMLFSTGIVGLTLFVYLLALYFTYMLKQKNARMLMLGISAIIMFIMNGITISIVEFTQFTWFVVMVYAYVMYETKKEAKHEKIVNISSNNSTL